MVYFPEPTTPDESWPGWDETAVEWFTRSTQPRARAVREFLNRSLECFPEKHARSLAKRLNGDEEVSLDQPGLAQRLSQDFTGWPDKRATLQDLLFARSLSDDHHTASRVASRADGGAELSVRTSGAVLDAGHWTRVVPVARLRSFRRGSNGDRGTFRAE